MTRIRKLLVANRGEIAIRIMRTCRELSVRTVAVYSEADRMMPHVMHADEAYPIGPAPSRQSYLSMDTIINVALAAGADAVHPGYGFLAENAEFADRVRASGLVFVGPPAEAIRAMGDKTAARNLVKSVGVPTVPGTGSALPSAEEASAFCDRFGFPVLLKAAAGGGGKGMRVVRSHDELASAFEGATSEARSAFGDGRIYLEKYLDSPRHVEFQIIADSHGSIVHLGERECTIQRRHQKIIEESPSVALDPELRERMGMTAVAAARSCGYQNAGTIEFLLDRERNFYFLEMNTRLQVEHPVTELRTGLDIVALQLRVAMGERLPFTQDQVRFSGHAMECRICAEDPASGFLPSTGTITHLRPAGGIGVREDRGVESGGEISVYYDSLIAKLIVWAPDREAAIERMRRALGEYEIAGVKTNIPVCHFTLGHRDFRSGNFTTHFLEQHFHPELPGSIAAAEEIAVAAVGVLRERQLAAGAGGTRAIAGQNGNTPSDGRTVHRGWKAQRFSPPED